MTSEPVPVGPRAQEATRFGGFWHKRPVVITGGASFIGSHLVDLLVGAGARVRVVDDLSSGRLSNLRHHLGRGAIEFRRADLMNPYEAERAVVGMDTLYHLAAIHGGRGFIDTHQSECARNVVLDGLLFHAAAKRHLRKVVFASSGCVYPTSLQSDPTTRIALREDMVGPPYEPDGLYGWAKLTGELTLRALHREAGLSSASCRLFTVYGPRALETHALMALMGRVLRRDDPLEVWGDGHQVRNWTFVEDVVLGLSLAGALPTGAHTVNLGSPEGHTVRDALELLFKAAGHEPRLRFLPEMPTGPLSRVASCALAEQLLGWRPRVPLDEGLTRTLRWYQRSVRLHRLKAAGTHLHTPR